MTTGASDATADITAGAKAAQWSSNVTITYDADSVQYSSDGLPSHEVPDQFLIPVGQPHPDTPLTDADFTVKNSSEVVTATPLDLTFPLNPVYSETSRTRRSERSARWSAVPGCTTTTRTRTALWWR
jgi:hypothetical protein